LIFPDRELNEFLPNPSFHEPHLGKLLVLEASYPWHFAIDN
jgi:hypothetical protein